MASRCFRGFFGALLILALAATVQAQSPSLSAAGSELGEDFKYLADNVPLDFADILTSPLHVADPDSPLRSPRFYLASAGAGTLWGGSFALDQTAKSHIGDMSRSDHDVLENFSYVTLISTLGLLDIYGLYTRNDELRDYLLTGTEAAGMGVLFNLGVKAAFGRLRPVESGSHTDFFHGPGAFNSRSFTSNDMVIETAMATGVSEYYDNKWYVALPVYSLVVLEGSTRIGSGQQWLSDVVAGGLLGWGSAHLLLWLHKRHAAQPDRWRIFPVSSPPPPGNATLPLALGVGVTYSW